MTIVIQFASPMLSNDAAPSSVIRTYTSFKMSKNQNFVSCLDAFQFSVHRFIKSVLVLNRTVKGGSIAAQDCDITVVSKRDPHMHEPRGDTHRSATQPVYERVPYWRTHTVKSVLKSRVPLPEKGVTSIKFG